MAEKTVVLHKLPVRLFPSKLPGTAGRFYARVGNERVLSIDEVVADMKSRSGYTGSRQEMASHVRMFLDEMAFKLCDGFIINMDGYFTIHPRLSGFFDTDSPQVIDQKKHRISFGFRTERRLRRLAEFIELVHRKRVSSTALIDRLTDIDSGTRNERLTPGGFFTMEGAKLKVKGDRPECGVWFVSVSDPQVRYKAPKLFGRNTSRMVTGLIPPLPAGEYVPEIVTQSTVGGIDLQTPRTVTGIVPPLRVD